MDPGAVELRVALAVHHLGGAEVVKAEVVTVRPTTTDPAPVHPPTRGRDLHRPVEDVPLLTIPDQGLRLNDEVVDGGIPLLTVAILQDGALVTIATGVAHEAAAVVAVERETKEQGEFALNVAFRD